MSVYVWRYLRWLKDYNRKMDKRRIKHRSMRASGLQFRPLNDSDESESNIDELHSALDEGESFDDDKGVV